MRRLGVILGCVCLAWAVADSGIAGAQPWQPRDLEPPAELPAATGLTRGDEAAMRLLVEAQMAYYLVRRLDDGSLRVAGCVMVRMPTS